MSFVARYERWLFIEESGDGEEVASLTCTNLGNDALAIDGETARFYFTDAEALDCVSWGAGRASAEIEIDRQPSHTIVVVDTAGTLPPGESLTVGVHVRRPRLAAAQGGRIQLNEPSWKDSFVSQQLGSLCHRVLVFFPPCARRRTVCAPDATLRSSRMVVWDGQLGEQRRTMCCSSEPGRIQLGLRLFDDLLVDHYLRVARASAGQRVAAGWRVRSSDQALDLAAHLPDSLSTAVKGLAADGLRADGPAVDRAWETRLAADVLPARDRDDVEAVADNWDAQIGRAHRDSRVPAPLPEALPEVLHAVLGFVAQCHAGGEQWKGDESEDALHTRLQTWFAARGLPCIREPEVGNGRIDLLAADVPVELKADAFGSELKNLVTGHAQQAAEYAVRRGRGAALLVGLDTSRPRDSRHGPHLHDRVSLDVVEPSNRSGSGTIVVALLINAHQVRPSALRSAGPRPAKRRASR